ncbi:hypothetical protein D3C86_2234930 [compost metagenome]
MVASDVRLTLSGARNSLVPVRTKVRYCVSNREGISTPWMPKDEVACSGSGLSVAAGRKGTA